MTSPQPEVRLVTPDGIRPVPGAELPTARLAFHEALGCPDPEVRAMARRKLALIRLVDAGSEVQL